MRRYLSVVCCYCPQRNPLGSSVHSRVDNCIVGNVKRKVITQNEEKSRVVVRCETAVLLVIGVSICVHHSGEGKRKANLFQTAQHSPRTGRVRFIAHITTIRTYCAILGARIVCSSRSEWMKFEAAANVQRLLHGRVLPRRVVYI